MAAINKVALAGATGNLGPAILDALLTANFTVTALTRDASQHSFPSAVTVKAVDYSSLDSLTSALHGQDALISTLSSASITTQLLLVEAASKASIKRFIPSEFGSNTLHPATRALPPFEPKGQVQDALKAHNVPYTVICTGPFLDWGLKFGIFMNLEEKTARLYDGGKRVFSTTTLPSIGRAVVGVLRNLEQTENRAVYVQDTATTLKALVEKGKKATGGGEGWKEEVVAVDEVLAQGWEELRKEKPDPQVAMYNFIFAAIWGEGYGSRFEKLDNGLLGVRGLSEGEVQALVEKYA